jgi:hypothetical protein
VVVLFLCVVVYVLTLAELTTAVTGRAAVIRRSCSCTWNAPTAMNTPAMPVKITTTKRNGSRARTAEQATNERAGRQVGAILRLHFVYKCS